MKKGNFYRRLGGISLGLLLLGAVWFATTDNVNIWPIRNTLKYHFLTGWWDLVGRPAPGDPGTLQGIVRNPQNESISGAWVLVSTWNGVTYTAYSDQAGQYTIPDIPAGSYKPVATAPGYQNTMLDDIEIEAGLTTTANIFLPRAAPEPVRPGQHLTLTPPITLTCSTPLTSTAVRREVRFDNGGQLNQLTFFYTPVTSPTRRFPVLLTIYPGPADTWECASIPLASTGYAVLAAGPAYTFELEKDIAELERLVKFVRNGQFPNTKKTTIALLGGSYSSIHVQRLLQRDQTYAAAVLLGPPTDLFDMRRRLENGTYIPPFDLDKALIALGLPGNHPLRYFRYSGAYHVRSDFPPLAVLHSRSDDVVPYQQSQLLAKNLQRVGAPHETFFFDGASHYLMAEDADEDTLAIYDFTLNFLGRYLQ